MVYPIQRLHGKLPNTGRLNGAVEHILAHHKGGLTQRDVGNVTNPGVAARWVEVGLVPHGHQGDSFKQIQGYPFAQTWASHRGCGCAS